MKAIRQRQFRKVRQIAFAWTFVGLFITLYDHFLLHSHISSGHVMEYSFWFSLSFNLFAGLVGGTLGGIVLVTVNRRIRDQPYIYGLWWGLIGFVCIVIFIMLITTSISTIYMHNWDFTDPETWAHFKGEIFTTLHLKNLLLWALVTLITQFCLQVSQKFGPGNLAKIITGKYHIPQKEKRIFMFLDLKSSTSIAEKLGEEKYHEFLQEVFFDVTDPINDSKAEIYAYVGDEVIITWDLEKTNEKYECLNVFFAIEKEFEINKEKYLSKYNVLPKFKAGVHIGQAIVGEIGIIKRDITYSGDLLNTTARIQGMCNELNSSLLISRELKEYLAPNYNGYHFQPKGFISLKGKEEKVELLGVKNK